MVSVFVKNNGNVLGPLPLEKVLTSYQRGQISSSAMISDNQTTWYPISNLEKLQAQQPEVLPSAPSQPDNQPIQQPYGQSMPQPYGQPMQQPYGQPLQPPYGQPMQQPYGQPLQPPYGQPVQQPYRQPMQPPYGQPMTPSPSNNENKSTGALVCGILSLIVCIPIISIPVSIVGLILGCAKKYKTGIILNAISLVIGIINCVVGAILGSQGKLF